MMCYVLFTLSSGHSTENSFVFQTIDRCHPCLKDLSDDRGAERERERWGRHLCRAVLYPVCFESEINNKDTLFFYLFIKQFCYSKKV